MGIIQPNKKMKSWISQETVEMFKKRDIYRETARNTQAAADWSIYKKWRNKCTEKMRSDKKKHFQKMYDEYDEKGDIKNLYRATKEQLGWHTGGPPQSLVVNGVRISAPKKIADCMQNYYVKKMKDLMETLPRVRENPLKTLEKSIEKWENRGINRPILKLQKITSSQTLSMIREMGNNTSFGHDFLDSLSIKMGAEILANPLTYLINLSLDKMTFAERWKLSRVIPLFKGKGINKYSESSYRPISLIPTVSKLVETTVHKQVLKHMEVTNQLNQNQHAYRGSYNTSTALLQLSDCILKATDHNNIATLITVDESAAFECVNHEILDKKLNYTILEQKLEIGSRII